MVTIYLLSEKVLPQVMKNVNYVSYSPAILLNLGG